MNEKYNALFTPWKIGNVEIKNRIVQCSMGGTSLFGWMEPNHFDKEAAYFLLNRAQDGVGLILPGMQCIRDPLGIPGRKWLYQNDQMFKQLKEYMVEFHKTGAKLVIQLAAGMGRSMAINGWMTKLAKNNVLNKIASPIVDVQYICASASEVPNRWKEDVMSRPLTVKEIEDMVYAFGQTAKKLRAAGIDGVEIHAVHEGYLLDQFTMANWNHRTDKYGGSFENRFRFPVEIVQEIKRQAALLRRVQDQGVGQGRHAVRDRLRRVRPRHGRVREGRQVPRGRGLRYVQLRQRHLRRLVLGTSAAVHAR